MDTVSRAGNAPVLVVLRAAAEIDGIPCRPDMSKEDIATAMLSRWAPHRLTNPDIVPRTDVASRRQARRSQSLDGRPVTSDSFLQAISRSTENAATYSVARDNAAFGIHAGDAVKYWESQGAGPKQVYGAVRGFKASALARRQVGIEVEIQRLYTQDELTSIMNGLSPAPDDMEQLGKHFETDRTVGPVLLMVVMSDWVNSVPLRSITEVHSLAVSYPTLESICVTEKSEDPTAFQLAYKSFLDTRRWTLHPIKLPDAQMNLVLMVAAAPYKTGPRVLLQGALGSISKHIFALLSRIALASPADPRDAVLMIPCAFGLFAHIAMGGPPCQLFWSSPRTTWTVEFARADDLCTMLGASWYRVSRPQNSTYTEVRGSVEIVYSHQTPGKIRFSMRELAICLHGGGAAVLNPPKDAPAAVAAPF